MDFLLALIELFSLGVTAEELRAIIVWKSEISFQRGSVDPKFHVEGVAPDQPFFFSEKWDKCSFVWYINLDRSFYRFVTMHACDGQTDKRTDGRTDRRTEFSSLYRVCIACSAVKNGHYAVQGHQFRYKWKPGVCDVIYEWFLLSCTAVEILRIIGPILAVDRGCLFKALSCSLWTP